MSKKQADHDQSAIGRRVFLGGGAAAGLIGTGAALGLKAKVYDFIASLSLDLIQRFQVHLVLTLSWAPTRK